MNGSPASNADRTVGATLIPEREDGAVEEQGADERAIESGAISLIGQSGE